MTCQIQSPHGSVMLAKNRVGKRLIADCHWKWALTPQEQSYLDMITKWTKTGNTYQQKCRVHINSLEAQRNPRPFISLMMKDLITLNNCAYYQAM